MTPEEAEARMLEIDQQLKVFNKFSSKQHQLLSQGHKIFLQAMMPEDEWRQKLGFLEDQEQVKETDEQTTIVADNAKPTKISIDVRN